MDEISDSEDVGKFIGQVKWWNDQLGFGFATVMSGSDKGRDVFVHHTGIRAKHTNYRTLLQGEYLNFDITNSQSGVQAINVTGVCGGLLMCEQKSWKRSLSMSSAGSLAPPATICAHRASSGGSLSAPHEAAGPRCWRGASTRSASTPGPPPCTLQQAHVQRRSGAAAAAYALDHACGGVDPRHARASFDGAFLSASSSTDSHRAEGVLVAQRSAAA